MGAQRARCTGPGVSIDDIEPGCAKFPSQFGHRPSIRVKHRVIESLDGRALEEPDEESRVRPQSACELGERNVKGVRAVMDE